MLHPEQYQQPEFTTFDRFVREYLATHDPRKLDGVLSPKRTTWVLRISGEMKLSTTSAFRPAERNRGLAFG